MYCIFVLYFLKVFEVKYNKIAALYANIESYFILIVSRK